MLIAQITDLHIGLGRIAEANDARLQQVITRLNEIGPDVVLATGDLTEGGDASSYGRLKDLLSPLTAPVLPVIGNHDLRPAFVHALGVETDPDGFVQYVSRVGDVRIVVLDTVEIGQHGGAFCERRAEWLSIRLDEERDTPTLIALHHPPVKCGIAWMDVDADGPWSQRLAAALADRPQVIGLIAGHVHRPFATAFGSLRLVVAPASAPQVVLDLAPRSVGFHGDFRPRIIEEEPGFALHLWADGRLISHFGTAGEHRVIAGLDPATGKMVAGRREDR
jgi:Icc protein